MPQPVRSTLHRFVPSHFGDPVGLALRLLRTRDGAAYFAMASAALGVVLSPLDLMLQPRERRLYRAASAPRLPLIFVCGPPRSGTTLVTQVLLRNLPVASINNLTSLFPRAPVTANRWFGRWLPRHPPTYQSYYGKSRHFSGPNDGLYLWDRWLGADRTQLQTSLTPAARDGMIRFFGAWEALTGRPLVAKNNNLNGHAALVGEVLPGARFICMRRDPRFLAQALLIARRTIHGRDDLPYGLRDPAAEHCNDPVEDVCRQVLFYERLAAEQLERLGPERFWSLSYEEFCDDPAALVERVSQAVLGRPAPADHRDPGLAPFSSSNTIKLDPEQFAELERTLERLSREEAPAR